MTTTLELRLKYREARQARNASKDDATFDHYQQEMEKIVDELTESKKK